MSLPLHLRAVNGGLAEGLYKVLELREALDLRYPRENVLIDLRDTSDVSLDAVAAFGFAGIVSREVLLESPMPQLHSLSIEQGLASGDAARVGRDGRINVLYRRGANANTLFVTERCNSLCLMCSQPPRDIDDSWRIRELTDLLPLIDTDVPVLGVTGGEPTLLGMDLVSLLTAAARILPSTHLHVLTNGRRFHEDGFADEFDGLRGRVTWAVPLYADVAHAHDFVVQSAGAFAETMHGLHNLGERGHGIEIRTVLHAQTLPRIEELARFIYRNLPFAKHVAFMGLEPMGLARLNAALLAADPAEVLARIAPAVHLLDQAGMHVSIYNLPLCAVPPGLRPFARRSISDWKNEYGHACGPCALRNQCCGFFRSTSQEWRNRVAKPVLERAA